MGPFRYANIIGVVVQQDGANDINIIPLDFLYMLSHLYEGGDDTNIIDVKNQL